MASLIPFVAYVAQDWWDPELAPWDQFDVLFIGGRPLVTKDTPPEDRARLRSQEWKRQLDGGLAAIVEGKRRGKRVHVGRVNGEPFLRLCASRGADSADGTGMVYAPDMLFPRVSGWMDRMESHAPQGYQAGLWE